MTATSFIHSDALGQYRQSFLDMKKKKEKFTLFSYHIGSLLRRQLGGFRDTILLNTASRQISDLDRASGLLQWSGQHAATLQVSSAISMLLHFFTGTHGDVQEVLPLVSACSLSWSMQQMQCVSIVIQHVML